MIKRLWKILCPFGDFYEGVFRCCDITLFLKGLIRKVVDS